MDVLDPPGELAGPHLGDRLVAGLRRAATAGLVEITEMGLRSWAYLDSLADVQSRPLPAAGQTLLSADPRAVPVTEIDRIEALGTLPVPF